MTSSLRSVNPNAESMDKAAALFMNINAAKGLQDVMKTNLGPRGTIKMLVDGAGGALLFLSFLSPLLSLSLSLPHRFARIFLFSFSVKCVVDDVADRLERLSSLSLSRALPISSLRESVTAARFDFLRDDERKNSFEKIFFPHHN